MKIITNLLDRNRSIRAETMAVSLFMSRLSTIKTQLRWNKLSTHMTWQTAAVTSHTMLPWWFHTPHTFITMNVCTSILSKKSKHDKIGKFSIGVHIFSKHILCSCVQGLLNWPWNSFTADTNLTKLIMLQI
jgi:hypothetical protein